MDETRTTAEEASDEAVHKAKNAAQAVEAARQAQQEELLGKQKTMMEEAVINALGRGSVDKKFVDVGRIPFICDDIRGIHDLIGDLKSDLRWIKWIGSGFVTAAGLLALKSLGIG